MICAAQGQLVSTRFWCAPAASPLLDRAVGSRISGGARLQCQLHQASLAFLWDHQVLCSPFINVHAVEHVTLSVLLAGME